MLFSKILSGGIHLEIGRMMEVKQMMSGPLEENFHRGCLAPGTRGERFGMMLLVCLLMNRNPCWIQTEKERRLAFCSLNLNFTKSILISPVVPLTKKIMSRAETLPNKPVALGLKIMTWNA